MNQQTNRSDSSESARRNEEEREDNPISNITEPKNGDNRQEKIREPEIVER